MSMLEERANKNSLHASKAVVFAIALAVVASPVISVAFAIHQPEIHRFYYQDVNYDVSSLLSQIHDNTLC